MAMDIRAIRKRVEPFRRSLQEVKNGLSAEAPGDFHWYPYESLMNFYPLEQLLTGSDRLLLNKIGNDPVLDLGCGDGDVSFFLESLGYRVHALDYPPTNFNKIGRAHV